MSLGRALKKRNAQKFYLRRTERLDWLANRGLCSREVREMRLDRWELADLPWKVMANEALRANARRNDGKLPG